MNLLSFLPIHYLFIFYSTNSPWIHHLFREFHIKSLSFHELTICFANSLLIHFLFAHSILIIIHFTIWLQTHFNFCDFTINSIFFRDLTMNSPSSPWIVVFLVYFTAWSNLTAVKNHPCSKFKVTWVVSYIGFVHIRPLKAVIIHL